MPLSRIVKTLILYLILCISGTSGDYTCLCSSLVNKEIFEKPDTTSDVDGFMKENDCKPVYNIIGLDKQFIAIGHDNKLGYVYTSPDMETEICQGNVPDTDKDYHFLLRTSVVLASTSPSLAVSTEVTPHLTSAEPYVTSKTSLSDCPQQVLVDTTPDQLHKHGNKCIEIVLKNSSWIHAKQYCNSRGGNLVSIENEAEQIYIRNILSQLQVHSPVWLGFHDRVNEEHWKWDDGTPVTYTNWMPGRYIDMYHDQEDCGLLVPARKGQWDDVICDGILYDHSIQYSWMCQYSLVSSFRTTVTAIEHSQGSTSYPYNSQPQTTSTQVYTTEEPFITHSTEMPLVSTNVSSTPSVTVTKTPVIQGTTVLKTSTVQSSLEPTTIATRTCVVCSGPAFLCEKLYESTTCTAPNNYCINKITNNVDGTRLVKRTCGNVNTCRDDWYKGSSDSDKCRKFDENNEIHLRFDCTFCCIKDNCNIPLRPTDSTLYTEV